jgi:hypothetical protein
MDMGNISAMGEPDAVKILEAYMAQNYGDSSRTQPARASFSTEADGGEAEPDYVAEARQSALDYARRRNANKPTTIRTSADDTETEKEARQSALDWLARKRRSVIRK